MSNSHRGISPGTPGFSGLPGGQPAQAGLGPQPSAGSLGFATAAVPLTRSRRVWTKT
jgi:hypothetical protein